MSQAFVQPAHIFFLSVLFSNRIISFDRQRHLMAKMQFFFSFMMSFIKIRAFWPLDGTDNPRKNSYQSTFEDNLCKLNKSL